MFPFPNILTFLARAFSASTSRSRGSASRRESSKFLVIMDTSLTALSNVSSLILEGLLNPETFRTY